VSNFLKNLAKRSAGLPLSTAYSPTPAPAFETRFSSGEALDEIPVAIEETAAAGPQDADTSLATPPLRSITVAPRASTHEIQRAAALDTSKPSAPARDVAPNRSTHELWSATPLDTNKASPPRPETSTVVHQSSLAPERDSIRNNTPAFQAQPDSALRPAEKALTRQSAFVSRDLHDRHDREGNEHSTPTVDQTIAARHETVPGASDLRPLISPGRDEGQRRLQLPVSADRIKADASGTREAPPADPAIRPARTEPANSFQFPKITLGSPPPPAPLPIQVRIGRIEVRGNAAQQASALQKPKETTSLGFAGYQRLRRYRN
jgi:hypothetical protein